MEKLRCYSQKLFIVVKPYNFEDDYSRNQGWIQLITLGAIPAIIGSNFYFLTSKC